MRIKIGHGTNGNIYADNLVDICVTMIEKLYKGKIL